MSFNSFLIIIKKQSCKVDFAFNAGDLKCFYQSDNLRVYANQLAANDESRILLINGKILTKITNLDLLQGSSQEFSSLAGQYQLIQIDTAENSLLAHQDYLGCLPLYYLEQDNFIAIANIINNFTALSKRKLSLNKDLTVQYLANNFSSHNATLFEEIKVLSAGESLEIKQDKFKIIPSNDYRSKKLVQQEFDKPVTKLRDLLSDRIKQYCDLDCGFELSGGLDSSAIVALACKLLGKDLTTYSISYTEAEMNEKQYIQALKDKFHFNLQSIPAVPYNIEDFRQLAARLNYFPDFPNSVQSLRILDSLASAHKSVLITGFGGDHLFNPNISVKPFSLSNILPSKLRPYFRSRRYFPWLSKVAEEQILEAASDEASPTLNHNYTVDKASILRQVYHASTAIYLRSSQELASSFGIRKLHPLFDPNLLELCLTLPTTDLQLGTNKSLLRAALYDDWPQELQQRTSKAEFTGAYYQTLQQGGFKEILTAGIERFELFLNPDVIQREFSAVQRGAQSSLVYSIWNLIGLELYCQEASLLNYGA